MNGKLAFDLVPANARESKVFVVFPPPDTEWGPKNGFPAPAEPALRRRLPGRQGRRRSMAPAPETPVSRHRPGRRLGDDGRLPPP